VMCAVNVLITWVRLIVLYADITVNHHGLIVFRNKVSKIGK
jgi:hypothetical protein